jgi:hypothetical protein
MLCTSKFVVEFGPGNLALYGLSLGCSKAVVVDPDQSWIELYVSSSQAKSYLEVGALIVSHADIGPVDGWGNPSDIEQRQTWSRYLANGWDKVAALNVVPDTVILSGRFRVAAGISALLAIENLDFNILLLDTGVERPYYKALLDFFDITDATNKLTAMRCKPLVEKCKALTALLSFQFDPR